MCSAWIQKPSPTSATKASSKPDCTTRMRAPVSMCSNVMAMSVSAHG